MERSPHADEPIPYLSRLARSSDPQLRQMVNDRDGVLREYGRIFSPERLDRLSAEDFKSFLLYDNNRHWWGISRQQARQTSDMPKLRDALSVLLDESRPIIDRLDWIMGHRGPKPVPGLGSAVVTPILLVMHPDRYAVWNGISEAAMQRLALWPEFEWGVTYGQRYVALNERARQVATSVGVDLWTLDALWWLVEREHAPTQHRFDGGSSGAPRSAGHPKAARAQSTFVCQLCFATKPIHLRHSDDTCSDCVD